MAGRVATSALATLTPAEWTLLFAIVVLAAGVQGALGFGFGLVALPVLGYLLPAHTPQVLILVGLPAVSYVVWKERAFALRTLRWVLLGRLLGTVPGVLLVALLPLRGLQVAFGVATLATVGLMLVRHRDVVRHARTEVLAGVLSGTMATATSLGGPVLAVLHARLPPRDLRAVMAWTLLFGNLLSLAGLRLVGRVTPADLALALLLLVPVGIGVRTGSALLARLSAAFVRRFVILLATVAALFLMVRALAGG